MLIDWGSFGDMLDSYFSNFLLKKGRSFSILLETSNRSLIFNMQLGRAIELLEPDKFGPLGGFEE